MISSKLLPAPVSLDAGNGHVVAMGRYEGRIADLSTTAWDGSRGLLSPRRLKRKAWMYAGAITDRWITGCAVVDAGVAATAFAYAYDRDRSIFVEEKLVLPLGFKRDFAPSPESRWELKSGSSHWRITPQIAGWVFSCRTPALDLEMELPNLENGVSAIAPAGVRPFHHTWKSCGLPVRISVRTAHHQVQLDGRGSLDFSLGYPPRRCRWNWASLIGQSSCGRQLAINLVADFNDGLENAIWVDGVPSPTGLAIFEYDRRRLLLPWRIHTNDGTVDVRFRPEGERSENLWFGVLASRFHQPFGRFEGTVMVDGQTLTVSGSGMVEQHVALW